MTIDLKEVASSWVAIQTIDEGTPEYAAHEAALRQLGKLIARDPVQAWHVAESVYEANQSNDWILENLGAGPVETLLRMHGEVILPFLTFYLSANPGFSKVIKHVWAHSLPTEISERLAGLIAHSA